MEFVYPLKTRAISVTGKSCCLDCAHCGGHFLEPMIPIELFRPDNDVKSVLISGGCDKNGEVPLLDFEANISRIRKNCRVVAHTGLFAPEKAKRLAHLVDIVSFDFPPDTKIVRDVFGIDRTQDDYIRSIRNIMRYVPVVPHLSIGVLGGKICGEGDALKMLKSLGLKKVVLNVFIPTSGTIYSSAQPPSIDKIIQLAMLAREQFDKVFLGCMRPTGAYRDNLDTQVLDIVDRIVMPSKKAENKIPDAKVFYECCAF